MLRAKLHQPRVTRDLVDRPRLLEMLDHGLDGGLALICAPAGFGKTTLVSSWLDRMIAAGGEGTALPSAWLTLDEQDSDLVVFLHYMIAALRTLFPGAASETLALLQAPSSVPLALLSTTLCNEIDILPTPFVLVLDDYHLLRGEAVHGLVEALLRHWPRPLHLVVISRVDPPIPLSGLRARGKMVEIRTADLRFSAEETGAYLAQALQRPLSGDDRALLAQHSGGWIAALRLATLSLRTTIDVEGVMPIVTRAGRSISDFLQGEVLDQQVPAIQSFLLKTSILDRFCVPLCEAVVGQVDPAWSVRACVAWLARAELLTDSPGQHWTWYRYHALVRDFLKARLLAGSGAEVVAELHRKAAAWFGQEGLVHEAMRHALEARDLDLAARIIEQTLRDILNREDRATLEMLQRMLPEEVTERRPWLLMVKAYALQFRWQLGKQMKVVSQVEALIDEGDGAALSAGDVRLLRGQCLALRAQEAYFQNQLARCVAYCEEARALLPRDWTFVLSGAILYWGVAVGAMGQWREAEHTLLEEYELLDDKTTEYAARILQALCLGYLNAGQLDSARQTAELLLQLAIRTEMNILQGWARFWLGVVYYQWNDLDAAEAHLTQLLDQRYLVQSLTGYHGMAGLARVYQIKGVISEAWRVVDILSNFEMEQRGREGDEVRSLRAKLMLDQGKREGAFRWADTFTSPPPDVPLLWIEVPHITRARILLARNRADDVRLALHILDELLDIAERTHNTRSKIPILALRALALDAQEDTERALVALQEAVDLSLPGGFLRAFIDLGPRMEGLLSRLAEQSSDAEPIRGILAAFAGSGLGEISGDTKVLPQHSDRTAGGIPATGVPALIEPLTARELQILTLLREPMRPKDIARQLDISYLTVKRHLVNIYGKLDVKTRWDAVSKAIELGILPPR